MYSMCKLYYNFCLLVCPVFHVSSWRFNFNLNHVRTSSSCSQWKCQTFLVCTANIYLYCGNESPVSVTQSSSLVLCKTMHKLAARWRQVNKMLVVLWLIWTSFLQKTFLPLVGLELSNIVVQNPPKHLFAKSSGRISVVNFLTHIWTWLWLDFSQLLHFSFIWMHFI